MSKKTMSLIFELPLRMEWKPKKDITVFELAQCLPYMNRQVMPYEITIKKEYKLGDEDSFLRHFNITNKNLKS